MIQRPHQTPDYPELETRTQPNPYTDQLVVPYHQPDTRIQQVKPKQVAEVPIYNELYDSLRSKQSWRYMADNYASGTITTLVTATATATVKLALQNFAMRLSQWPGAVQLFLVVRSFSFGPQVAPATTAILDVVYQDTIGGFIVPIGEFLNTTGGNASPLAVIPQPITDSGIQTVGQLQISNSVGGTTVGTYNWQLGFSYAYLLPAIKGYELEKIQDTQYEQAYS